MMINTNISDHTLALFGKSADQTGDKPSITTDVTGQAASASKYAPTPSVVSPRSQSERTKDAASSYRPKLDVEMPGHYADPRAASGTGTQRASPAYDGPSYTERAAGGSLLDTVMTDLEAIKNNQLADMQAQHTAIVEAALGRSLAVGERSDDFNSHAILHRDDVALGTAASGLDFTITQATREKDYETRSGLTLEGRTESERMEEYLTRSVRTTVQLINSAIAGANEAGENGFGSNTETLPPLSAEETDELSQELMEEYRKDIASGNWKVSFR